MNEQDTDQVSKYRADVIGKSINMECIIDGIISQHYLNRIDTKFLLEVLYDEYFSVGLKLRILKKLCNLENSQREKLGRLNNIRNIFAHCGYIIVDLKDPDRKERIPDPKDPDKGIDFTALYKEFIELEKEIVATLAEMLEEKGGQLMKELPET